MLTVVVYICMQGTVSQSHMVRLNEARVTHRSATKRRRGNPEAHPGAPQLCVAKHISHSTWRRCTAIGSQCGVPQTLVKVEWNEQNWVLGMAKEWLYRICLLRLATNPQVQELHSPDYEG